MNDRTLAGIFLSYILGFVFTFGHAYNAVPSVEKAHFGGAEYVVHNGVGTKTTGAFLASMVWPLYWSAQAWK